ncbi:hypothetical protein Tco_0622979 [Tanacetum coccineum]
MVFHNEDGNPARANIKQALGYLKDGDGDGNSKVPEAPEKVTATDLFYLTSMDKGTAVSIPYLLAQYLFRHDKRRKRGARFFGEYFVGRLVDHFGLVTEEGFQELTVEVGELR